MVVFMGVFWSSSSSITWFHACNWKLALVKCFSSPFFAPAVLAQPTSFRLMPAGMQIDEHRSTRFLRCHFLPIRTSIALEINSGQARCSPFRRTALFCTHRLVPLAIVVFTKTFSCPFSFVVANCASLSPGWIQYVSCPLNI